MRKSPFKNFVITIGNLPTAYMESMSYYEALTFLTNYIANNIAPAEKANSEAITELQEYVANYFDNLDVTEEVNNKLDEMAEDGTLARIINVEQIGSLANLETTDKTNLVNAINEVDANVKLFNINDFHTFSPSGNNMTVNNGTYVGGNIRIAKNSNGSIAKIYGVVILDDVEPSAETSITLLDTGLEPSEQFTIYPSGTTELRESTGGTHVIENSITVLTNGNILIETGANTLGSAVRERVVLFPCIYFIKDFGDE